MEGRCLPNFWRKLRKKIYLCIAILVEIGQKVWSCLQTFSCLPNFKFLPMGLRLGRMYIYLSIYLARLSSHDGKGIGQGNQFSRSSRKTSFCKTTNITARIHSNWWALPWKQWDEIFVSIKSQADPHQFCIGRGHQFNCYRKKEIVMQKGLGKGHRGYLYLTCTCRTTCIIFLFSFFCRSTLKHDLSRTNGRRCWDSVRLGARSPSACLWYTPAPLATFHVRSWTQWRGPILLSEFGLASGRLWYHFCKYIYGPNQISALADFHI